MKKLTSTFIVFSFVLFFTSCKKLNDTSCDAPVAVSGEPVPFNIISDSIENATGTVQCTTRQVEFGPKWWEFISLDPQGSAIWIGGGLYYPSVVSGAYTPITGNRKPITISVNLPGIAGNAARTIENPSLSSTRTAMNELLQQQIQGAATPAQISWSQTEIYNERHFKLAIGGNYGNLFFDINGQYNYNSSSTLGRFLFQFTQVYYSVDCDAPSAGIGNFFNNPPQCGDPNLGGYSPCYVSSVKYGRKVYLMVESSSYDYSHMGEIKGSFDAFFSSGGGNVSTTLTNLMSQNSIKGVIIGGPSYEGIQVINNLGSLRNYLLRGANFDMSSPGVPLSYTLRFMKDNSVASVVKYDRFTIRDCTIIPPSSSTETIIPSSAAISEVKLYQVNNGADKEFAGHGPKVTNKVSLFLRNGNRELWLRIYLKMEEVGGDHTTGERTKDIYLKTAPSAMKINSIATPTSQTYSYTDNDLSYDEQGWGVGNLIKYVKYLGDTDGDDIELSDTESTGHLHKLELHPITLRYVRY